MFDNFHSGGTYFLGAPSKSDGISIGSFESRARSSRAVVMLQTAHVFNVRPIEAYSHNVFSLISLWAADAQIAFDPDTSTVEPLLAALRPKVRALDLSYNMV